MQPIPIRCIRTVDDLNELYAYVSTKRSELSYTNFTLVNQHHNQLVLHSQTSIMLRIAFYLLIMLVSLVGNVLVIVVIVCNRFMHKSTNYFILNLVVCDLAIVFSCMWVQIVVGESKDWTLGSLFCKVNSFMQMVSILASVFTLVAVSCDRFVAVMYPLRAHLSNRSTFVCIFSIWALSALIALPTFYYRSYSEQHWSDFVQRSCDDMSWPITLVTNELGCVVEVTRVSKRVYFTAVILCLFFLPMIVLLLTCTIMIRKLMGDTHIGELTPSLLTQKNKKKVIVELLCLLVIFFMLWSPLETMLLYMEYTDSFPSWWPELEWLAYFMAYANTALNPYIYAGVSKNYKNGFKSLTRRLTGSGRCRKNCVRRRSPNK